jgi:hypothetical protein
VAQIRQLAILQCLQIQRGYNNTALGFASLYSNRTGFSNTAIGLQALYANQTASSNTAIGLQSLNGLTSGNGNLSLAASSAQKISSGATLTSATNSIFIGRDTRANANAETNQIVIGDTAIGIGSNSVVLGNDSITKTALKGNVLINTTTDVASSKLTIESTTQGFLPPRMTTTEKNAIATPAAGLVVYDTDLNQLCTYDGTWGDSPFYQQSLRGVRFFTDFDSSTKYDNFVSLTSGVAASTARLTNFVPNQTANQIGIAHYQTGTATTGWAMHITEQSANAQQFQFGGGTWMYESYIEVDILSDATNRFRFISGFGNVASSGTETNGAFFTYDEGGVSNGTIASPNWQCVTTVGAVRTLTTTSVAVTTTWTKLRIIVNADATEVKFYIDGILVATHTANIPVLPNRIKVLQKLVKNLGTGNRFVYCDYIFYENNLTTLR